jgi:Zn ribbon nucleic-acid-binding protein
MTSSSSLYPCPFCGAYAYYIFYEKNDLYAVTCVDCSVMTNTCKTQVDAKNLWNKRVKMKDKNRGSNVKRPQHNNPAPFIDDFLR